MEKLKFKWSWGWGIFATIIGFVSIIITMIVIVQTQLQIDLVYPDYYEREVAYQDDIERQKNALNQALRPQVHLDSAGGGTVRLVFPHTARPQNVRMELMKPNKPGLDFEVSFHYVNSPVSLALPEGGAWKLFLHWEDGDRPCTIALGTRNFLL
jgi:hypothetical protein